MVTGKAKYPKYTAGLTIIRMMAMVMISFRKQRHYDPEKNLTKDKTRSHLCGGFFVIV
jgi:hypothetical protein